MRQYFLDSVIHYKREIKSEEEAIYKS